MAFISATFYFLIHSMYLYAKSLPHTEVFYVLYCLWAPFDWYICTFNEPKVSCL